MGLAIHVLASLLCCLLKERKEAAQKPKGAEEEEEEEEEEEGVHSDRRGTQRHAMKALVLCN